MDKTRDGQAVLFSRPVLLDSILDSKAIYLHKPLLVRRT